MIIFMERTQGLKVLQRVKGRGLMLGLEFDFPVAELRKKLVLQEGIFTGGSAQANLMRILPPLTIDRASIDRFFDGLTHQLNTGL